MTNKMKFYTIGYGGRDPQDFVNLLKQKDIKAIVDVRMRPEYAYLTSYAKIKSDKSDKGIEGLLQKAGVAYFSFVELGNIFLNYPDWRERYKVFFAKVGDLLIERLSTVPAPFCLMCAEKKGTDCHRQIIADYLVQKGYEVEHIQ